MYDVNTPLATLINAVNEKYGEMNKVYALMPRAGFYSKRALEARAVVLAEELASLSALVATRAQADAEFALSMLDPSTKKEYTRIKNGEVADFFYISE